MVSNSPTIAELLKYSPRCRRKLLQTLSFKQLLFLRHILKSATHTHPSNIQLTAFLAELTREIYGVSEIGHFSEATFDHARSLLADLPGTQIYKEAVSLFNTELLSPNDSKEP
jgi:hypothetical protein